MKSFLTWTFGIAVVAGVGLFFYNKSTKKSNIEIVHQEAALDVSEKISSVVGNSVVKGSSEQSSQVPTAAIEEAPQKKQ